LAQAATVQALLLAQVNLSATMYSSSSSEQQHLVSQDIESAAELVETSDGEVNQPMQISRIVGRGLAAAAVLAVVGWAGLHVPTGKAKTISKTDAFQGLDEATYGSQWGVTEQPYGDGVSPFGTDAPSAVATVAPTWSNFQSSFDYSKNYNQASSAASNSADASAAASSVSATHIESVNDLTGGASGSPSPAPGNPLGPKEDLNDGNKCGDDEEDFANLCYAKCSILTNGEKPVRISSFGCAKSHSFGDFFGEKTSGILPCHGYDISGDDEGNGCPHKHGACLVDEEISLGKCYEKCSELTSGQYPYRTGADTCCKSSQISECLSPTNVKFDADFNKGGGSGTEAAAHAPETKFTER